MVKRKQPLLHWKVIAFIVVLFLACFGSLIVSSKAYLYCRETEKPLVCSTETKKWIGKYALHVVKKLF